MIQEYVGRKDTSKMVRRIGTAASSFGHERQGCQMLVSFLKKEESKERKPTYRNNGLFCCIVSELSKVCGLLALLLRAFPKALSNHGDDNMSPRDCSFMTSRKQRKREERPREKMESPEHGPKDPFLSTISCLLSPHHLEIVHPTMNLGMG